MVDKKPAVWARRISESTLFIAQYIVKISVAWSVIWAIIWFVGQPLVEYATAYIMAPITHSVSELANIVDKMGRRVSNIDRSLNDILPSRRIADYDTARSFVFYGDERNICYIGQPCRGQLRVRRTKLGQSCGRPDSVAIIANHFGTWHPITTLRQNMVRVGDDFVNLPFQFILPMTVQTGIGELWFDLEYPDCDHVMPNQTVKERSHVIEFTIRAWNYAGDRN